MPEDPVADALDRIAEQWDNDDPEVLVFRDDEGVNPTVADVDGDLRLLSMNLVQARAIGEDDVRAGWDRYGKPDIVSLSTQSHRFGKRHFEDVADLEGSTA
ncbi:hypothetical protein SAMN05216388_1017133 [Halorientalis persicus]|uniref:Uncharacterized protein n=1 Tax=Halorientalis persicus TaxID=1367881 RepID=A0A1H8S343_9EURY|nr:hypothetical protein [Halorientalis persicus]SEO73111.1 hypothetical protein SAMN05216388_1017133 [Halorientalis persicus]